MIVNLACVSCGRSFEPGEVTMACPDCGPDDGILDILYDLDAVHRAWRDDPLEGRAHSHWRYHELLPLDEGAIPHHWQVGWTPIINAKRLAGELGIEQLLLKDESRGLTASFKDRASSVGVADALQRGATTVACASTGNAATSLAGFAALAGLRAVIFVPETAPEPKLAQLLVYGATVLAVKGSYDEAYRLCSSACERFGWYNRNCAINPVLVEGKKTGGLEIAEQCLAFGGVPDWVVVSMGDGCTIAGIWKGLVEMHNIGVIGRLPRLLGVQGTAVAPIAHALEHGELPAANDRTTVADSINVQAPRNWRKAVRALKESNGAIVGVTDDQILEAMRTAGRHGVFAEPAAAAAVAGMAHAVNGGTIQATDRVLALITGSGLKDTRSAIAAGGEPIRIEPTMDALTDAIDRSGARTE
ncbi:MAG: threonine synthase [Phycisphaerales bacterium]|nr:threonine synthase [Phycisphaerales bacterium]